MRKKIYSSIILLFLLIFSCGNVSGQQDLPALSDREKMTLQRLGGKLDKNGNIFLRGITIDRRTKEIAFPAETNIREGTIEVIITTEIGRTHESLFITQIDPFLLQLSLILAGYRNGPVESTKQLRAGDAFDLIVKLKNGQEENAERWLYNATKKKDVKSGGLIFIGSNFLNGECMASKEGNLIDINSNDENSILCMKLPQEELKSEFIAVTDRIVKPGKDGVEEVAVTLILRPKKEKVK